jgi:hypothetical protein
MFISLRWEHYLEVGGEHYCTAKECRAKGDAAKTEYRKARHVRLAAHTAFHVIETATAASVPEPPSQQQKQVRVSVKEPKAEV